MYTAVSRKVVLRYWQTKTHCCRHKCFPVRSRAQHLLRTQICVRDTKNVSDFVQKHFVSAANVFQFAQPKKHHEQQYVRNNVSSFASTFTYAIMSKVIMGNGGFYGCLIGPQDVSAWWKETAQTRVFVLSRSLLLNRLEPQSSKAKLLLPIMPIAIVV